MNAQEIREAVKNWRDSECVDFRVYDARTIVKAAERLADLMEGMPALIDGNKVTDQYDNAYRMGFNACRQRIMEIIGE